MEPFDCELLAAGWPAQPVNAASALGFAVLAAWLWQHERRVPSVAAAAVCIGSVWFHADPSAAASWAHDIALYALVAVAAAEVWRRLRAGRPPWLAAATFAVGALIWFSSRTGGVLCDPESLLQGHAAWHLLAASAVGLLYVRRGSAAGMA